MNIFKVAGGYKQFVTEFVFFFFSEPSLYYGISFFLITNRRSDCFQLFTPKITKTLHEKKTVYLNSSSQKQITG